VFSNPIKMVILYKDVEKTKYQILIVNPQILKIDLYLRICKKYKLNIHSHNILKTGENVISKIDDIPQIPTRGLKIFLLFFFLRKDTILFFNEFVLKFFDELFMDINIKIKKKKTHNVINRQAI